MKKIIITGPTGAIGIAFIKKCIQENTEVLAICRKGSERIRHLPVSPIVTIAEYNLCELASVKPDSIMGIQEQYDCFYHLGWEGTFGDARNDTELQLQNVAYTLEAVKLAKRLGCTRFIGVGSQAEYGRTEGILKPDTPTFPETGYGIAKLCAGNMSKIACRQMGIEHIWVRVLSVYGPYDGEKTMIMSTIDKLLSGKIPQFTMGEQKWDYLYSQDAAEALYLLFTKGGNGKVYCLGSGKARPLAEYIYQIRDAVDTRAMLGMGKIPYRKEQVMYLCADISDLTKDTGFSPKTAFQTGIENTIDYCKHKAERKILKTNEEN